MLYSLFSSAKGKFYMWKGFLRTPEGVKLNFIFFYLLNIENKILRDIIFVSFIIEAVIDPTKLSISRIKTLL